MLGNVTVVQSYARFASEMQAMRTIMAELLAAQYPVLTWWGLLTVLTRIAATITVVAIYAVGAVLVARRQITVGEIVAFVGFAGLLIGKLDLLSGFAVRIFQYAPTLRSFFDLLDATEGVREKPDAKPLAERRRQRALRGRDVPLQEQRPGRVRRRASRRRPARPSRWSAPPAPARPRRSPCCSGCARSTRAASWSTATTSPT